ncbi:MAG TPA: hypothetical protein VHB69_15435 [Mycobacteriales bacterium]|nr:hypothetical protein [Mycobacteriales bacterium]
MPADREVFHAALTSPPDERAALTQRLLANLGDPADDPVVVAAEGAAGVEGLVGQIATGGTEGISGHDARRHLDRFRCPSASIVPRSMRPGRRYAHEVLGLERIQPVMSAELWRERPSGRRAAKTDSSKDPSGHFLPALHIGCRHVD